MLASVEQIAEGALDRTLARLLKKHPEEATELHAYFEENPVFFVRLSWAVVNRLLERRVPQQAAEAAVQSLNERLTQGAPGRTVARWFRANAETLMALAVHIAQEAVPHVLAHAKSGLALLLRAEPNLDFAPGSHEATVKMAPRWLSLESLGEGRELVDRFLTEYQLGSGNWTGGHVRKHGIPFARFSYNRRLWLLLPDGQETPTELDLQGNPLLPKPEQPLVLSSSGTGSRSGTANPRQLTEWRLAGAGATAEGEQTGPPPAPAQSEPSRVGVPEEARALHQSPPAPAQSEPSRASANLDAQRNQGQRWIERKVRLPLQEADYQKRWRFAAHEKFKEAQARSDESSVAFWQGVVAWLEEHQAENEPLAPLATAPNRVPAAELERSRRAAKLRKLAEGVASEIDKLRDSGTHHQRPTARRIRILTGQEQEADRLEQVRTSLLALADALENKCEPPSLQGVDLGEYRCLPESIEGVDSRALVQDLLDLKTLPRPRVRSNSLNDAFKQTEGVSRLGPVKALARRLLTRCGPESGWCLAQDLEEIRAIEEISRAAEERAVKPFDKSTMRSLRKELMPYKRALAAGLTTQEAWAQARTDLQTLRAPREPRVDPIERQIREAERALIGLDIPGYFPTPREVVERMIIEADLQTGLRVLEPSAGKGSLADAIRAAGIEPDVIEIVPKLRELLRLKKHRIVADDFLSFVGTYDRILMNPPFEHEQDIEHVRRAYKLLAPGGRIVAIMSAGPFFREDKQATEFRRWLEEVAGDSSALPDGSFLKSDRPAGVSTRLVVIDKPGFQPMEPPDRQALLVPLRPTQSPELEEAPEPPTTDPEASAGPDAEGTSASSSARHANQAPAPKTTEEAQSDAAELRKHGLVVRAAQTQPTRPGKPPRAIWIVKGNTPPYRMALRELGGKQFRGDITFWNDPSSALAGWLRENGRPSLAERLADRQDRSAARAERLEARALRKTAEAERAFSGANRIADGIPMGQPILVGHHSEARHRRDLDRMHRRMDQGVAAHREATELHTAARTAAANAEPNQSRRYLHNRIEEARAKLASVRRLLTRPNLSDGHREQLGLQEKDYAEQLAYWSAEMERAGGVPFGPHNVRAGDRVRYRGTWYPVVRTNQKTVTVSGWLGIAHFTWKAPWAEVQAHEPAGRPREDAPDRTAAEPRAGEPTPNARPEPSIPSGPARSSVLDGIEPEPRTAAPTDRSVLGVAGAGAGSGKVPTMEAELAAQDGLRSAPASACPPGNPACGLGLVGGTCTIPAALVLPSAQGAPTEQTARFCLAEASQLIPSHDPLRGFMPRADYPTEVQERRYERDKGEQLKVLQIAQTLRPELIFNAAPGAIDGPPVVTEQGYVLGGNGRTMGLQLHYHQGGTAAREYLREHAHAFGFTRVQVAALRQPVIVRVVLTDGSRRHLQELVRLLNVPLTQSLDVRSESVSEARRLSAEALSVLAAAFEGEETLADYLSSRASKPFTEALRRSGILTDRNASRFLTPLETYTDEGKVFVERLLTAALLPDATLLDQLGPEARQTLARGAPWLLTAASFGGEAWDLRPALRAAAVDWVRMKAAGQRSVEEALRQEGLFVESQPAVRAFPLGTNVLRIVAELVGKPVKFTRFARAYAEYARQHPEGQSALFPSEVLSPADALVRAATAAGVPQAS